MGFLFNQWIDCRFYDVELCSPAWPKSYLVKRYIYKYTAELGFLQLCVSILISDIYNIYMFFQFYCQD